jgi:hypothetical protein
MAKEQKPLEGLTAASEEVVEKTMKQVEGILENYFSWLHDQVCVQEILPPEK